MRLVGFSCRVGQKGENDVSGSDDPKSASSTAPMFAFAVIRMEYDVVVLDAVLFSVNHPVIQSSVALRIQTLNQLRVLNRFGTAQTTVQLLCCCTGYCRECRSECHSSHWHS